MLFISWKFIYRFIWNISNKRAVFLGHVNFSTQTRHKNVSPNIEKYFLSISFLFRHFFVCFIVGLCVLIRIAARKKRLSRNNCCFCHQSYHLCLNPCDLIMRMCNKTEHLYGHRVRLLYMYDTCDVSTIYIFVYRSNTWMLSSEKFMCDRSRSWQCNQWLFECEHMNSKNGHQSCSLRRRRCLVAYVEFLHNLKWQPCFHSPLFDKICSASNLHRWNGTSLSSNSSRKRIIQRMVLLRFIASVVWPRCCVKYINPWNRSNSIISFHVNIISVNQISVEVICVINVFVNLYLPPNRNVMVVRLCVRVYLYFLITQCVHTIYTAIAACLFTHANLIMFSFFFFFCLFQFKSNKW